MNNRGLVLVAVAVLAVYAVMCMFVMIPKVEDDLNLRCRTALRGSGISIEGLSFDGRDATLSGPIASAELSQQARRIVAEQRGVRKVINRLEPPVTGASTP